MSDSSFDIIFSFNPDYAMNCSLKTGDGAISYEVVTECPKTTACTYIKNASSEVLGCVEWRSSSSDRVSVDGSKAVSLWDWFQKSKNPFKRSFAFTDNQNRKYSWKPAAPGQSLALYLADGDSAISPIAEYHPGLSHPDPRGPSYKPVRGDATLSLGTRAREVQDLVVVSCLFLVKNIRDKNMYQAGRCW